MEKKRRRSPWFGVWHVGLIAPVVALVLAARRDIGDNSFLWHIQAGNLQRRLGSVLTVDPFSFSAEGRPWRTQSWLVELMYSVLDDAFGFAFVPAMLVLASTLLFVALGLIAYKATGSLFSTVVYLVMSTIVLVAFLNPRPVIFSFILFALVIIADGHRRLRWSVPIIVWIWAASHGSFVLAGAYLVLQSLRSKSVERFKTALAAGALSLMTAHGIGVVSILLNFFGGREAIATIREWATPDLVSIPLFPFLIMLLLLPISAMRGQLHARDMIVVAPFVVLALSANRSLSVAWIALSPWFAKALTTKVIRYQTPTQRQHRLNIALATLLVVVALVAYPRSVELDESRFPLTAVAHLEGDRLFHDDAAGGYLIYAAWPDREVFVDDRAELFNEELPLMVNVRGGRPEWHDAFAEYGFDEVLLRHDDPLVEILQLSAWSIEYQDEDWVIVRPD